MRFIQGDNFNTIYNVVQPQMKTPLNPQQPKTIKQTTCSTKGTRKNNFHFKYTERVKHNNNNKRYDLLWSL